MKSYIILFLIFPHVLFAQNQQIVEVVSGDNLSEIVSQQFQYVFPEFTNGDVYFIGMPKSSGILNYNMLVGEMQFVENGRILALANVDKVVLVTFDNRRFYPFKNKEFTEELLSVGSCYLRVRYVGNASQHGKKGAYGTTSSTSSITSLSSITGDNRQYNLNVIEDLLVTVNQFYYLVGTNGKYTQIKNQRAFTKLFPRHKTQIQNFVRENNTQFNDRDELIALLQYCGELNNQNIH